MNTPSPVPVQKTCAMSVIPGDIEHSTAGASVASPSTHVGSCRVLCRMSSTLWQCWKTRWSIPTPASCNTVWNDVESAACRQISAYHQDMPLVTYLGDTHRFGGETADSTALHTILRILWCLHAPFVFQPPSQAKLPHDIPWLGEVHTHPGCGLFNAFCGAVCICKDLGRSTAGLGEPSTSHNT